MRDFMTNRCYEGSLQVSLADSLSSRASSSSKLRAYIAMSIFLNSSVVRNNSRAAYFLGLECARVIR